jgi:DNA modification methylase
VDKQMGLEATPDAYIAAMVAVFREVRRVLRNDGTCWVNIGDSYNANQGSGFNGNAGQPTSSPRMNTGLAPKQLLLMPARLALALQADGWWVRSDIIWAKPNPMPESVTDRCVSAHEHVFMLTKRPRYYFDATAIAEPATADNREVFRGNGSYTNGRSYQNTATISANGKGHVQNSSATRSCRNVWTIATEAYPGSHFATFPTELASHCIRAGTSERGCCAACGAPWVRVTDKTFVPQRDTIGGLIRRADGLDASNGWKDTPRGTTNTTTTGWSPSCQCDEISMADPDARLQTNTKPCTVLDPFVGSGTTLLVADRLQRDAIGIDLNTGYAEMAVARIERDCPLFTSWAPAEDPEDARMADLFQDMAAD